QQERGIDLAKLDEWEQTIEQKSWERAGELHDRTIGFAVETLAQDETIAQLLDLKSAAGAVEPQSEYEDSESQVPDVQDSSRPDANGTGSDAGSAASIPNSSHEVSSGTLTAPTAPSATEGQSAPSRPTAPGAARATAGASRGELRQLDAEVKKLSAARDEAERRFSSAESLSMELEARLAEMSAVSDDALGQVEESKQQVSMLRRAVEEKDARLVAVQEAQQKLEDELLRDQGRLQQLEANFQERLQREVSQKEQELLEEVAYLRKTGELKEKRVQELQAEKAAVERRLLVRVGDAGGDSMLEAHTAIARAFGDLSAEHPVLRVLDQPSLKLMAALFKTPPLRRVFFVASALVWLFALSQAVSPGSGGSAASAPDGGDSVLV
ncbi:unnamed protein product, partial [Polarella glacialis]